MKNFRDLKEFKMIRDLPAYKSALAKYAARLAAEDARLQCPRCQTTLLLKNGNRRDQFRCPLCRKTYTRKKGIDF